MQRHWAFRCGMPDLTARQDVVVIHCERAMVARLSTSVSDHCGVAMTAAVLPRASSNTDPLYVYVAYACALIAFAGFIPTYWAPVATGSFTGPPLLHLHGLLFSAWMVFFIVQTRLVDTGRVERHRVLGLLGISLGRSSTC